MNPHFKRWVKRLDRFLRIPPIRDIVLDHREQGNPDLALEAFLKELEKESLQRAWLVPF